MSHVDESLEVRVAELEHKLQLMDKELAKRDRSMELLRAVVNANAITMYGVLNAIGHNEWIRRCVDRRLDLSYEAFTGDMFSQDESDAYDCMASNFRYCMTEGKEAVEFLLGGPEQDASSV